VDGTGLLGSSLLVPRTREHAKPKETPMGILVPDIAIIEKSVIPRRPVPA
jgi:hypothetical protein